MFALRVITLEDGHPAPAPINLLRIPSAWGCGCAEDLTAFALLGTDGADPPPKDLRPANDPDWAEAWPLPKLEDECAGFAEERMGGGADDGQWKAQLSRKLSKVQMETSRQITALGVKVDALRADVLTAPGGPPPSSPRAASAAGSSSGLGNILSCTMPRQAPAK